MAQYVKVYTTTNCQSCRATKRWLDRRGVEYEAIDVTDSPTLVEVIRAVAARLGVPAHMPLVEVHGDLGAAPVQWFDFRPDLLDAYLSPVTV